MTADNFAALTQEEQVRRIELLGREALRDFGVVPNSLEPLTHAENTTYRVRASQGDFCLRVCRPGYQSDSNVVSEIQFMAALREAGFDVPRPFESRVVKAAVPDVPEHRNCVLLSWQEGEFAQEKLTPPQAELLGAAMAKLHAFSATWPVPPGFDRRHLHAWEDDDLALEKPNPIVDENDRSVFLRTAAESRQLLKSLPRDPSHYGLIHGDLHRGNVLFDGQAVRIIDFDDTGWAFWIADLSAALAYEMRFDGFAEVRDAMLSGYESIRPLPPETRRLLPAFLRMRLMTVTEWVVQRSDNPQLREAGPAWVKRLSGGIRNCPD